MLLGGVPHMKQDKKKQQQQNFKHKCGHTNTETYEWKKNGKTSIKNHDDDHHHL